MDSKVEKIDYTISHGQNFDQNFPSDYGKKKNKPVIAPNSSPAAPKRTMSSSQSFTFKSKKSNQFDTYIPSNNSSSQSNDASKKEQSENHAKPESPTQKPSNHHQQQKPQREEQGRKTPSFGKNPQKEGQNEQKHNRGNGGGDKGRRNDNERHGGIPRSKSYTKSLKIGGKTAPLPPKP